MPFSQSVYTLVALLVASICATKFLSVQSRKSFSAKNGCRPPPALRQNPWLNGFDASYHQIQWMKNNEVSTVIKCKNAFCYALISNALGES